jgi:hypothetical protein
MMMRLPVHLQQLISAAREQVLHHPEHHLLPVNRLPIYAALEPAAGQDVRIQLVRGRLAIATARYVFPIWQQALPIMGDTKPAIDWRDWVQRYPLTDALPEWMLQQAEAVLHDTVDIETVCEDSGDLWYVLSNFYDEIVEGYTDAPEEAWFACKAAYQALSEVTGGLEPLEIDPSLPPPVTDDDVENLDGAGAAMHAFAGVGLADPGRATRRRTFWEWWLMEAIPAAWDATQVPEFNG